MSARMLRAALTVMGIVGVVFGLQAVVMGADSVVDAGHVSANVDSEFRFFAVWYAGAGVLLLEASRHPERRGATIRGICAALFVTGCARALSIVDVGTPDRTFLILMGLEFGIPLVIVPWQAVVQRHVARQRADARGPERR